MKTSFKSVFAAIGRILFGPPITQESLAATYAAMPDAELRQLDPSQLTPEARSLWRAEMSRRKRGGTHVELA